MTTKHPANGPVSLDRLHQIREHLQHDTQYSNGGNRAYILADVLKVIDGAIAAFGAEPVAIAPVMYKGIELLKKDGLELIRDGITEATELESMCMAKALLSAQPALVVPDKMDLQTCHLDGVTETYAEGWNACRAAILQGADRPQNEPQNIPENIPTLRDGLAAIRNSGIAIDAEKIFAERDALNAPDCWCRTCRPITLTDMRFVVCPECGNKRCPHANDHRNACTGSNEPGQEGSAYPAAPKQEAE